MADTGFLYTGTGANDSSPGGLAWNNPSRIQAEDNLEASNGQGPETESQYLKGTNFGFSIPSGATIEGIEVVVRKRGGNGSGHKDVAARIIKGGTIGSTDKSNTNFWPTTRTDITYGGPTELWGETWTHTDINASNFGFALRASTLFGATSPFVDSIKIKVYYTEGTVITPSLTSIAFSIGAAAVITSQILSPSPIGLKFSIPPANILTSSSGVTPIGLLLALTKTQSETVIQTSTLEIGFEAPSIDIATSQNLSLNTPSIGFQSLQPTAGISSVTEVSSLEIGFETQSVSVSIGATVQPNTLQIGFSIPEESVAFGQTVSVNTLGIGFEIPSVVVAFPAIVRPQALQIGFALPIASISGEANTALSVLSIGFSVPEENVSISVSPTLDVQAIGFSINQLSLFTENYLSLDELRIGFFIPTPQRTGGFYTDKYQDRNTSYSDKYSTRSTSYGDKYTTRDSEYEDKYSKLNL